MNVTFTFEEFTNDTFDGLYLTITILSSNLSEGTFFKRLKYHYISSILVQFFFLPLNLSTVPYILLYPLYTYTYSTHLHYYTHTPNSIFISIQAAATHFKISASLSHYTFSVQWRWLRRPHYICTCKLKALHTQWKINDFIFKCIMFHMRGQITLC